MHIISFFWMMLLINAKQIYRSSQLEEMVLLPYLLNAIEKVQLFLGLDNGLPVSKLTAQLLPGEKMKLLYALADQMGELMAGVSVKGEEVPTIILHLPGVYRYLRLIDEIIDNNVVDNPE